MTNTETLTASQTDYLAARENADFDTLDRERSSLARVITRMCIDGEADFPLTRSLMWQFQQVERLIDGIFH